MVTTTSFLVFWAFAISTLCVAFIVLTLFHEIAGSELVLGGIGREFLLAVVTSLAQATAAWFCAPFMHLRGLVAIAAVIAAFIYWVGHFPDWVDMMFWGWLFSCGSSGVSSIS